MEGFAVVMPRVKDLAGDRQIMNQPKPRSGRAKTIQTIGVVLGTIIGLSALLTYCSYASRTPAQKAMDDCYEQMRAGVRDSTVSIDYNALKKQCEFMCVTGKLDGCK